MPPAGLGAGGGAAAGGAAPSPWPGRAARDDGRRRRRRRCASGRRGGPRRRGSPQTSVPHPASVCRPGHRSRASYESPWVECGRAGIDGARRSSTPRVAIGRGLVIRAESARFASGLWLRRRRGHAPGADCTRRPAPPMRRGPRTPHGRPGSRRRQAVRRRPDGHRQRRRTGSAELRVARSRRRGKRGHMSADETGGQAAQRRAVVRRPTRDGTACAFRYRSASGS